MVVCGRDGLVRGMWEKEGDEEVPMTVAVLRRRKRAAAPSRGGVFMGERRRKEDNPGATMSSSVPLRLEALCDDNLSVLDDEVGNGVGIGTLAERVGTVDEDGKGTGRAGLSGVLDCRFSGSRFVDVLLEDDRFVPDADADTVVVCGSLGPLRLKGLSSQVGASRDANVPFPCPLCSEDFDVARDFLEPDERADSVDDCEGDLLRPRILPLSGSSRFAYRGLSSIGGSRGCRSEPRTESRFSTVGVVGADRWGVGGFVRGTIEELRAIDEELVPLSFDSVDKRFLRGPPSSSAYLSSRGDSAKTSRSN